MGGEGDGVSRFDLQLPDVFDARCRLVAAAVLAGALLVVPESRGVSAAARLRETGALTTAGPTEQPPKTTRTSTRSVNRKTHSPRLAARAKRGQKVQPK